MNILTNKSYKTYSYTSRYASFPFYYNTEDKKNMYGLTGQLDKNIKTVLHTVEDTDTLDKLALKYYGRPDLYWVIADFNNITDPYINLYSKYNYIDIPALADISFTK